MELSLMYDVYLMRHGLDIVSRRRPTRHAPPSSPLSIEGAAAVSSALSSIPGIVMTVLTSSLQRGRATGELIAHHFPRARRRSCVLLDEWHAPSSGWRSDPSYDEWRRMRIIAPETPFGDGETVAHMFRRARIVIGCIARRSANVRLVVVSHKILLGAMEAILLGEAEPARHAFDDERAWRYAEIRAFPFARFTEVAP
jgi:broad specificity phosphatase PhoE